MSRQIDGVLQAERPDRGASDDRHLAVIWSRDLPSVLAASIAILAIVVRFWVSHRTHSLGEDALITLRYAENIAAGRGWVTHAALLEQPLAAAVMHPHLPFPNAGDLAVLGAIDWRAGRGQSPATALPRYLRAPV